jgi:hypothetical protein
MPAEILLWDWIALAGQILMTRKQAAETHADAAAGAADEKESACVMRSRLWDVWVSLWQSVVTATTARVRLQDPFVHHALKHMFEVSKHSHGAIFRFIRLLPFRQDGGTLTRVSSSHTQLWAEDPDVRGRRAYEFEVELRQVLGSTLCCPSIVVGK